MMREQGDDEREGGPMREQGVITEQGDDEREGRR